MYHILFLASSGYVADGGVWGHWGRFGFFCGRAAGVYGRFGGFIDRERK